MNRVSGEHKTFSLTARFRYNDAKPSVQECMKKRIRGLKRAVFQLDFDLYRVKVPIRDFAGANLSVIDLWPQDVEKTLFFQHGFAGVAESWEWQLAHFANQYRVIAPDLRGHGQSDAPHSKYSMPELIQDMHDIVEKLNLPQQFCLGRTFLRRRNLH